MIDIGLSDCETSTSNHISRSAEAYGVMVMVYGLMFTVGTTTYVGYTTNQYECHCGICAVYTLTVGLQLQPYSYGQGHTF
jgi:hypothetical protein